MKNVGPLVTILFVMVLGLYIKPLIWNRPRRRACPGSRARTHTRTVMVQEPVRRAPEYRDPPIKQYKPGRTQQMGILVGQGEETLPLYGKEVRGRRDQYHYYTTTGGENLYPIPVRVDTRDCMDDIGCQELYGNETVSVLGKAGVYTVKLYRTDSFF